MSNLETGKLARHV